MSNTMIQPYLFFGGRCEAAIEFYRQALGATVEMLMRHKDSPDPHPPGLLAPGFEEKIMHATLRIGEAVVMMSDGCDQKPKFDGFRLSLTLADEAAANRAFAGLSDGGQVEMPLTRTFWSPCFGMVTDRFGVGWMITVTTASPEGN
ncbi:MAG: VOC family protein [Verrucomicrobiales bacterium]|nr:VOC family protein [Verrucomicrobiales bacterium]